MSRDALAALVIVLLVAGCGSSEPAAPGLDATPEAAAPAELLDEGGPMTLGAALDQLARRAGVNVVLDPTVSRDLPVEAGARQRANAAGSWRAALDVVAASAGCEVDERPAGLYVVTIHSRVDVAIAALPARSALRLIAAWAGRSLVVSRAVPDAPLDLALDGVKWRALLEQVVASLGPFEVVEEGGDLLRIEPRADAGPLRNRDETDTRLTLVAGAVGGATPGEVQLQPDGAGEALRLRVPADESAHARRLRSLLANLDERAPRLAVTADRGRSITNAIGRAGEGAPR